MAEKLCECIKPYSYCLLCGKKIENKSAAILGAIREAKVGDNIIIHNEDMSIWCIITKKCEEHPERKK